MAKKPPELPEQPEPADERQGSDRHLHIDNLHLHANDLDSLRRLSESDPELARMVVRQKSDMDRREHVSYRFGVVATVLFSLSVLALTAFVISTLGMLQGILAIFLVVAMALLVRVILTGEWSDTSVFGSFVNAMVRLLGGGKDEE